jgi:CBS domain-containing protein
MTHPTPETSLRELVQRGTVTVPPSATLRDAAFVMEREEVGAVVVVVEGRSAGLLSERDVVRAVANGDDVDDVRVDDVMAVDLVSASVDDTVAQAATAMLAATSATSRWWTAPGVVSIRRARRPSADLRASAGLSALGSRPPSARC